MITTQSTRSTLPRSLVAAWFFLSGLVVPTAGLAASPQYGGEYRAPLSVEPVMLDPARISDIYSINVAENLFDGLIRLDQKMNVVGAIARRWKISRDHRTYTFELRDDVRFHNGRTVTADDFVFSFQRLLDPAVKSPAASLFLNIEGARRFQAGEAATVSGISAPRPLTLKIVLEKPFAPFLSILAMANARVVPQEALEDDFGRQPIGTGPYRFQSWEPGKEIVLRVNEDYFDGRAFADRLRFRIYANDNWDQIFADFQQGRLDHARVPKDSLDSVAADTRRSRDFRLVSRPGLNLVYVGMNLAVPPFDDVRVRQALNYALDTRAIVGDVTRRGAAPATGMLPPGLAGYSPDLAGYRYDPQKARELLAAAGFPDGRGFPAVELWTASKADSVQAELRQYRRYFADVGIEVNITTAESWQAFVNAINEKKVAMFYAAWYADYPDADNFFYPLAHSASPTNRMGLNDPDIDRMVTEAREEINYIRRTDLYRKLSERVLQQAPTINQHHNSNNYLFRAWVQGNNNVSPLGIAYLPLHRIWIDQDQRRRLSSDGESGQEVANR